MIENKNTKSADEMDKIVGVNIKLRRLMLGISLKDMKNQIGLSIQQLDKYEKGINRVSSGRLFAFSKIMNVPIDYFFNQIGERKILINECKSIKALTKAFTAVKNKEARKSIIKLTKFLVKEV